MIKTGDLVIFTCPEKKYFSGGPAPALAWPGPLAYDELGSPMRLNVPGFNRRAQAWLLAALMVAASGPLSEAGMISGSPSVEGEAAILDEGRTIQPVTGP